MLNVKQLREQVGELVDKCEALNALADSEGRELTAEESKQFDAWMAEIGNDGDEPTGLNAKIAQAEKFEKLLAQKSRQTKDDAKNSKPAEKKQVAVPKSRKKLRAFDSSEEAYESGLWFLKNFSKREDVRQDARNKLSDMNSIYAVQTIGTDADGGYTVPELWSSAIINVMETAGVFPQLLKRVDLATGEATNIPKRVSGQTVYYPGEASAITASDKTYGTVALTPVKRAVLTQISNELVADSIINIVDDVASEMGHQLALRLDVEAVVGDGTSSYGSVTGLVDDCGAAGTHDLSSGETAFSDIALADLHAVQGKIAEKFWDGGNMAWVMRRSTWAEVIEPIFTAGGGNTIAILQNGTSGPSLLGYPVYLTDAMPASAVSTYGVFFGNFNAAGILGMRKAVELASSQDYAFNLDVLTLRALARYDINIHDNPGSGSNYGAYAGIKTAAS